MKTQVIISEKDFLKLKTFEKENVELREKLCNDPKSLKFIREFQAKETEQLRLITSIKQATIEMNNATIASIKLSDEILLKKSIFEAKINAIPKWIRLLFKLNYEDL